MDGLCGAPQHWKGSVWGTALKTIHPSHLTCSKSILLGSQDPALCLWVVPRSSMEKVEELLGCSASDWVKLCGYHLQIWVLGTCWDLGVKMFGQEKQACSVPTLSPVVCHPQSPNPSWDAGSDRHLQLKAGAGPSRGAGHCKPAPGRGTLQGAEHPMSLWVSPCHPVVVALQNVHAMTPSAPDLGSPVLWAESDLAPVLNLF